jgi:hypothetical protein
MRTLTCLTPVILLLPMIGCQSSTDERLVEMAKEHAARQAETQRQMTDLQKQVAEGSRKLVESDAKARQDLTALQHELRSDQAEIHRGHDQLEAERREMAGQRYRDPIIAAILTDVGVVLACLLPLIVCIYLLWSVRHPGESDSAVAELLVQELVATEPRLLLPDSSIARLERQAADPELGDRPGS